MTTMLDNIRKIIDSSEPIMPLSEHLGFRVKSVEFGHAEIEFEVKKHHTNRMGTLHGGVLCALADTAMGVAFAGMLEEGESLTTLELKINYLKPVWNGKLLAVGKVVKKGKLTGLVECDIVDEKEQLVARASSTYMTLTGDRADNRIVPNLAEE